jgi:tetratricopeptide (TPR) repeat protein
VHKKMKLATCLTVGVVLMVVLVLLALPQTVDAKRKRRTSSTSKTSSASVKSAKASSGSSIGADGRRKYADDEVDEEVVKYKDQRDINNVVSNMNKNLDVDDDEMTDEEYEEFKLVKGKEEAEAKKNVFRAKVNHGEDTRQVADSLHKLGKVLYEQIKFEEAFDVAKEVVRIHTKLYGPDSEDTMKALGNFGSVACRMNRRAVCDLIMYRVLDATIKLHGKESKQELLQRGRLMTFQVPHGDKHPGIDQATFEDEIAEAYEELADQKKAKEAAKLAASENREGNDDHNEF